MAATILVEDLIKRFGQVTALDGLSFEVAEGTVTGFLGPNGAGKTTTLRILLGLVRPTAGRALIDGRPYGQLEQPTRHVGAVLEATSFHPGRSARDHLRVLARAAALPGARVDAALTTVELRDAADRRVGGFSLGMRQRLGLAAALLGDPAVLVLDEPTNGLDPEGIHWIRAFLRRHADAGGTVLISSHQLAELSLTADHVVIIRGGRLVRQGTLTDLTSQRAVVVRTPNRSALVAALHSRGLEAVTVGDDEVRVADASTEDVGGVVAEAGIVVFEMRLAQPELESTFLDLTTNRSLS